MIVKYGGEHRVYFGELGTKRNGTTVEPSYADTWVDWHLIPVSRPVIAPPPVKKNSIDIIGANSAIDLTDVPRGFPSYGNRTGTLDFYVDYTQKWGAMRVEDYDWTKAYFDIANYLHGKRMKMYLDDDRSHYYYGRFAINSWKTDKTMSTISIDYDLDPYAYSSAKVFDDHAYNPLTQQWDGLDDRALRPQDCTLDFAIFGNEWSVPSRALESMPVVPGISYGIAVPGVNELYAEASWTVNNHSSGIVKVVGNGPIVVSYPENPDLELAAPFSTDSVSLKFYFKENGIFVPASAGVVYIDFRTGRL